MANSTTANDVSTQKTITKSRKQAPKPGNTEQWTVDALQRLAVDTFRMHAPLLLINFLATKLGFELLQMLLILVRPDRLFPKLFATEEMYNLNLAWTQSTSLLSTLEGRSHYISAVASGFDVEDEAKALQLWLALGVLSLFSGVTLVLNILFNTWLAEGLALGVWYNHARRPSYGAGIVAVWVALASAVRGLCMAAAPLQLLSAFATVCIGSLQMGWYLLLTGFLFTFDWSVPKLVGLSLAFPSRAMRRCGYWTALVDTEGEAKPLWWPYFCAWFYFMLLRGLWTATFYLLTPDMALLSGLTSVVGLCYNSVDWVVSSVSACMTIGLAVVLTEQKAGGKKAA